MKLTPDGSKDKCDRNSRSRDEGLHSRIGLKLNGKSLLNNDHKNEVSLALLNCCNKGKYLKENFQRILNVSDRKYMKRCVSL